MKILNVTQGSPEWKAGRKKTRNASDYPSAQGASKKFSRIDLVKEAATGIDREFSAFVEEKILPNGHRVEALARPMAVEIIGEELFPLVATSDDGYLGASSDGCTLLGDIGWECKQWNEELAAAVSAGSVPDTHVGQLDQQALVLGFEKILFMVTDGTPEKTVHCWHTPTVDAMSKIIPTWRQFDEDVANHQHIEAKAAIVADPIEGLPSLIVQLSGQVVASNLESFKTAVTDRIKAISTELVTDQDFVNADKMVKFLGEGEKQLEQVKKHALAQTESIDILFRTIDSLSAEMKSKRLALDKLVSAEKTNRKNEIVLGAGVEFGKHYQALFQRVGQIPFDVPSGDSFAEAIRGLKSIDSMRKAVSAVLANAKVEASMIADRIDANRKAMAGNEALFPDFAQLCTKETDDFIAVVAMRAAQQKERDEKRLEAEREKIRAEEQARAQREAEAKALAANNFGVNQIIDTPEVAEEKNAQCRAQLESLGHIEQPLAMVDHVADAGKTIKLGEICALLGFTVTADFLSTLGFDAVAHNKNAKLYYESSFKGICAGISAHVLNVGSKPMKEAA